MLTSGSQAECTWGSRHPHPLACARQPCGLGRVAALRERLRHAGSGCMMQMPCLTRAPLRQRAWRAAKSSPRVPALWQRSWCDCYRDACVAQRMAPPQIALCDTRAGHQACCRPCTASHALTAHSRCMGTYGAMHSAQRFATLHAVATHQVRPALHDAHHARQPRRRRRRCHGPRRRARGRARARTTRSRPRSAACPPRAAAWPPRGHCGGGQRRARRRRCQGLRCGSRGRHGGGGRRQQRVLPRRAAAAAQHEHCQAQQRRSGRLITSAGLWPSPLAGAAATLPRQRAGTFSAAPRGCRRGASQRWCGY